jgi:hypothetical protein
MQERQDSIVQQAVDEVEKAASHRLQALQNELQQEKDRSAKVPSHLNSTQRNANPQSQPENHKKE